jgi:multiple sugar transport system permease protein
VRFLRGETPVQKVLFLLIYIVLIAWAMASLFPLYWMMITAIKPPSLVISTPPEIIPSQITARNFMIVFEGGAVRWTLNSVAVAVTVTIGQLLFASMAGYAFAKKEFPLKNVLFWIYVSSMMIPIYAIIVPLYWMISHLRLMNSYAALILPGLAAPFGVFLMRQFVQTLPSELIDASRIDGCSEWQTYRQIILPLATPGLTVLGIFSFADQWNAFFWPLVVTNTKDLYVLTVGVASLQLFDIGSGVKDYGVMMAGATWAAVPMFIIFFALQRYFLQGVTLGALKG